MSLFPSLDRIDVAFLKPLIPSLARVLTPDLCAQRIPFGAA